MDYLLTNEGAALMTQAVSGKNLIFTRAEAGTGYSSSPAMLTQVIGSLQTLDMSVTHEGSDVRIACFLTNRELEQGYTLKQLGIYARLAETEADTLVVIGQQYSGEMIHPFADGEAEYEFVILMKASGTSSITVESGAGSLVTKRELNAHVNRMDNPHGVTKKDIGLDKVPNLTVDDMAPSFMEAEKRENVRSGEKSTILWGKVRKWLSDLKSGAFAIIANNCTTTEEGTVLDGRQGKALQDQIVELREADSEINSNMGFCTRLNNGIPEWSARGADTWLPFKVGNAVWVPWSKTVNQDSPVASVNVANHIPEGKSITASKTHVCIDNLNGHNWAFQTGGTAYSISIGVSVSGASVTVSVPGIPSGLGCGVHIVGLVLDFS